MYDAPPIRCDKKLYGEGALTIKTLIELFDECQLENVIAGLYFEPETIVFVGYRDEETALKMADLELFCEEKMPETRLFFEMLTEKTLEHTSQRLSKLADSYPDCAFDMTGGDELVLAAMSVVAEEKDIPMLRYDVAEGTLCKVRGESRIEDPYGAFLTAEESVMLNGGKILEPEDNFSWMMTAEFRQDIETMWDICRNDTRYWNRQIFAISTLMNWYSGGAGLTLSVKKSSLPPRGVFLPEEKFLEELSDCGLLFRLVQSEDFLSFRFKNEQVARVLFKAGNILELYGYMLLREICEEDRGFYDDVQIGVSVDWDGIVHYGSGVTKDTKNEIDLLIMRKLIPVFISCKNGEVHKEALYELETVAKHYGGKYAKKILLATYVDSDDGAKGYILQRAKDMDISILSGIHSMSKSEIKEHLRELTK